MKMQAEEVPMSVVASFRELQELIDRSLLPAALSTSTELVVSDDGKMVRRRVLFSDVAAEEVQSRTIIAEKLPDDHHYQNLMRIFSAAGSVKSIRTCYPQGIDISVPAASKLSRIEMLFANQLHAFVEYETVEAAEKAVAEFNGGGNWRDGPRVCSMLGILKHGWVRGRESGEDEAADEDNPGTLQAYEAEDKAQGEKHDKIIAVCAVDPEYCHTRDTSEISRFFEDRKNDNKEVAVNGFLGAKYAIKAIKYSSGLVESHVV